MAHTIKHLTEFYKLDKDNEYLILQARTLVARVMLVVFEDQEKKIGKLNSRFLESQC